MTKTLRIGTRGSKLALFQAGLVADALKAAHPGLGVEIVEIQTSGDWKPAHGETRLAEVEGGKGLFAREIEQAILDGSVDCGVHSLKDMPAVLPEGLVIRHVLERADPRDALLANNDANATVRSLDDLPQGAVVGTSSMRRQAMILAKRPDIKIKPLRGNVPTRIEKLRAGQVDATLLALAGLTRLGLAHEASCILEPDQMLPAAGQGIVGIEIRANDTATAAVLDSIHHCDTGYVAAAERATLAVLDGSCRTPIGAFATLDGGVLTLRVMVASPDGGRVYADEQSGPVTGDDAAARLGQVVGLRLKARVPSDIFS